MYSMLNPISECTGSAFHVPAGSVWVCSNVLIENPP
jgi:hypothetical protein